MSKPHAHVRPALLTTLALTGAAAGVWLAAAPTAVHTASDPAPDVQVVAKEAERRVDVTVAGKPFTSYVWPVTVKKPVLYPLRTAAGTVLSRGFPLDPRPGERVDHPHHVGMWLNYGDVNGLDFWNNSDAIKPEERSKYGSIEHTAIVNTKGGNGRGELTVSANWVGPDQTVLLKEETRYIFHALGDVRMIDRITTVTAQEKPVTFGESKEGVLGLRVRRQLEEPSKKPEVFTDAKGNPTSVPVMDNTGVDGVYLSSEGKKTEAEVWGTRGRWCMLSGVVDNEPVTIAILDHPKNPNHPTHWHARGYGLFAANDLAAQQFNKDEPAQSRTLKPGESLRFAFRVLLLHGTPSVKDVNLRYTDFTKDIK
jgi:Family of unknown function (DUF6807)